MLRALLLALLFSSTSALAQEPPLSAPAAQVRELLTRQKVEDAVSAGEAASLSHADDADVWLWLGNAYGQQAMRANLFSKAGFASKCRAAYEKAVALDPDSTEARFGLMQYYAMAPGIMGGSEDKARAQAAAIARLDAGRGHLAAATLAQSLDEDPVLAEKEIRAAVATSPDLLSARLSWTRFLMANKRGAEAQRYWQAEAQRVPDDPVVWYMRARVAVETGEDLAEALTSIERYIAQPTHIYELPLAAAHWRRGLLLEKLGRKPEAIVALEQASQLAPWLEDAKKDLERLRG